MLAGNVVGLPRVGRSICAGCGRVVPRVSTVALDLPGGGWVIACPSCYAGDVPAKWRGLSIFWDGERWCARSDDLSPAAK